MAMSGHSNACNGQTFSWAEKLIIERCPWMQLEMPHKVLNDCILGECC